MNYIPVFLIAIGLAMDAFAISVSKGLAIAKIKISHMLIIGVWFAIFQAGMSLAGYFFGEQFSSIFDKVGHIVSFILLVLIGAKIIYDCLKNKKTDSSNNLISFKEMLLLAIATSIDAFVTGITFTFQPINIFIAITIIGVVTFIISIIGVKIGSVIGSKFNKKAELTGGVVLVILGFYMLVH